MWLGRHVKCDASVWTERNQTGKALRGCRCAAEMSLRLAAHLLCFSFEPEKTVLEHPIAGPPAGPSRAQNDSVAHGGWWSAAWSDWLPNSRNLRQFEEAVDGF